MNQALVTKFPVTDKTREAMAVTLRGCEELIPQEDWLQKLAKSEATGVPLRIKLGLDPTAPDIHIGHTVVLNKMRQLQNSILKKMWIAKHPLRCSCLPVFNLGCTRLS